MAVGEAQEEVVAEVDPAAVVILHQAGLWAVMECLVPMEEATAPLHREDLLLARGLVGLWEEAGSRTALRIRRLHLRRRQGDGCVRIIPSRLDFSSIL